ncbi:hypothetical protein BCV70DRAFT_111944 [Testicularia cyperi]|uniref:Uncharacterized protein n=1 Tax=Testicularia cyperi TaxID=1882483 RepID=A0A317XQT7_9BASI|nr:hypothetical protein BCV70DRAFT_111944 [Testicularia cyperi]
MQFFISILSICTWPTIQSECLRVCTDAELRHFACEVTPSRPADPIVAQMPRQSIFRVILADPSMIHSDMRNLGCVVMRTLVSASRSDPKVKSMPITTSGLEGTQRDKVRLRSAGRTADGCDGRSGRVSTGRSENRAELSRDPAPARCQWTGSITIIGCHRHERR